MGSEGNWQVDNWQAHVDPSDVRADLHITTVLIDYFLFSLKLLPTSLHYQKLLSHTYHPLSLIANTTITSYHNVCSETNVFTFISPGRLSVNPQSSWQDQLLSCFTPTPVFTPVCFHSVLCPCFKRERLTDWGGQMTIQVWAGANPNPSSGFPTQGQQRKEGKGCHSVSRRYKSQW